MELTVIIPENLDLRWDKRNGTNNLIIRFCNKNQRPGLTIKRIFEKKMIPEIPGNFILKANGMEIQPLELFSDSEFESMKRYRISIGCIFTGKFICFLLVWIFFLPDLERYPIENFLEKMLSIKKTSSEVQELLHDFESFYLLE